MKLVSRINKLFILVLTLSMLLLINTKQELKAATTYQEKTQETRAVWVSTFVGDIPAYSSEAKYKSDLKAILDNMEKWGFNTMVFHVRTHNNAMYKSTINPISNYWSTVNFETFDPLTYTVEECHKRGIELHAWLNPYRVSSSGVSSADELKAIANKFPSNNPASDPSNLLYTSSGVILDPGLPNVRKHIVDTCMEIVNQYDVDAIHFDDYFYISGCDDTKTRNTYNKTNLSLADFRRQQVDILIEDIHNALKTYNDQNQKAVQLGISPSSVYQNGSYPTNTTPQYNTNGDLTYPLVSNTGGFAHYGNYLYCDTKKWIDKEWIDYITPQTYHSIDNKYSSFSKLTEWWNWVVEHKKVNLSMGVGIYMAIDSSNTNWKDSNELKNQMNDIAKHNNIQGLCFYKYATLKSTNSLIQSAISTLNTNWTKKVPGPVLRQHTTLAVPLVSNITLNGNTLSWSAEQNVRGYMVWQVKKGEALDTTNINHLLAYTQNTQVEVSANCDYYVSTVNLANVISDPVAESKTNQIDKIINLISALPSNITLEDETNILSIKALYDALNESEKAQVINYQVLVNAIKAIETQKELNEVAKEFVKTLKTDVTDRYLLPLYYEDYKVSWKFKNANDSKLFNIASGEVLVEYLATTYVCLEFTLTKGNASFTGYHNLNIGYTKTDEVGLFYRNTPNALNKDEDPTANVSFIGWSGIVFKFTIDNVKYVFFPASKNYHVLTDSNIPGNSWSSCGDIYDNQSGKTITAVASAFDVSTSTGYGYFIFDKTGKVITSVKTATSTETITLKPGDVLYCIKYLDGLINPGILKSGSNIPVGTVIDYITNPTWKEAENIQQQADLIINEINKIPSPITLESKTLIERLETMCSEVSNEILKLVTNYQKLVDARTTLNGLISEYEAIQKLQNEAQDTLNNYYDPANYSSKGLSTINSIMTLFAKEVKELTSKEEIDNLVNSYKTQIDQVQTKQQEDELALNDAKIKAMDELDSYVIDTNKYTDKAQDEINGYLEAAKTKVNNASSLEMIEQIKAECFENIRKVETKLDALKKEKTDLINEFLTGSNFAKYNDANKTKIRNLANVALTSISKSTTVDAVNKTYNQFVIECQDTLDAQQEQEVLNNTKTSAKEELNSFVDLNDYDKNEQKVIISYLDKATNAINNATSIIEIYEAVNEAKDKIKEVKVSEISKLRKDLYAKGEDYINKTNIGNNQKATMLSDYQEDLNDAKTKEALNEVYNDFIGLVDSNKPTTSVSCFNAKYISSIITLMALAFIVIKKKSN